MREARRGVEQHPETRPPSGPIYDTPPDGAMPPSPLANGCDEACQYRDWLNRYAAWYRDFGRYYYGAPPAQARSAPSPVYGQNRPAPAMPMQATRPGQSERDRLDPWHGYNAHNGPANGY